MDQKSKKLIFVGYDKNSRNYRLYNPITKKILVSRDVIFHEKEKAFEENEIIVPLIIEIDNDKNSDDNEN